jgi:1,4-dihydroxy-2-naphthoate octaprenyltransferase
MLGFIGVTALLALAAGAVAVAARGGITLPLALAGAFFVLFYTWPLKYIALGELAVLIVWGPLMIGGGYYVITGQWSWNVALASLPYALGVTTVIFGKHIDKSAEDRAKKIYTLPVLIGEKAGRYSMVAMFVLQYATVVYLVIARFFTPVMLAVFLALPALAKIAPMFRAPKPAEKPANFPAVWPNYFVAAGFYHNRAFGVVFLFALIVDAVLKHFI